MRYTAPELRSLGTLTSLTLGMNGSCPDGGGRNNTQLGGGLETGCGESGDNNEEGGGVPFLP